METYLVGGAVRDRLLGIPSKDLDYAVVLDPSEIKDGPNTVNPETPFQAMSRILRSEGYQIFLESPEYLTIRAMSPDREAADFVLARKESGYSDGRRPDVVEVGTLLDDLSRRDFAFNAIAMRADGSFVDPYNGRQDIAEGVIRAVGSAFDRFTEDALRAVRALRFSVTKGFRIDPEVKFAMESAAVLVSIRTNISDERIEQELQKMFRFDTRASLRTLQSFPQLTDAMFSGKVSLDATMKTKGRGRG